VENAELEWQEDRHGFILQKSLIPSPHTPLLFSQARQQGRATTDNSTGILAGNVDLLPSALCCAWFYMLLRPWLKAGTLHINKEAT